MEEKDKIGQIENEMKNKQDIFESRVLCGCQSHLWHSMFLEGRSSCLFPLRLLLFLC